jgi:Ca2+-binding EF-hand superfamily protein
MKAILSLAIVSMALAGATAPTYSVPPSDQFARNAFREILAQTDANKDGKLSLAECKAMFRDSAHGQKNCTFWDVNHDGTITADEYANTAMGMGRKR